ncbi:IucA/IucC family protein [Nocardiopsis suaedae]|uniref:Siderophore biosynthesis protein n=1 Tax=Nocardiopsis suaedae TaxID=3018444 RepID=A0ABT4TIW9_9ACTN|nr:IucA/IucC family protein [Nocardiopsis suaedae]MDA2804214.1 siderophore biosynthesis protein [Nocardiopsis suaedae]
MTAPPVPELPVAAALRAPAHDAVRWRVFRQLVESLLYEDAVRTVDAGGGAVAVEGADDRGEPVRYVFTARRRYGFGRVALGPDPVRREAGGASAEADSPARFLAEARPALTADPDCLARFARELEATLVKDTLAQYVRAGRGDVMARHDYDTLEGTVTDGHRYHPAYKSRIGFDLDDHAAYGPEFLNPVRPLWVAARRDVARVSAAAGLDEDAFLDGQLGADTAAAFRERLAADGLDPGDYTPVPVHPWQWREHIAPLWAAQLRRQEVVPLGEDPHAFAAQQSIRTLSCRDAPERPYLKLALSIVNTSTSRVLAPHTVANAPLVSDWLRGIAADDAYLRDECRTIVLGEVMGASVDPAPAAEMVRSDTYGALACIWRESLHPFLREGERAVPFTALTARELDSTPMVDPWVRAQGVRPWVRGVVRAGVLPLLHLLFRHGIACEAHAQNMVLVHRDGVPERVALKDFHDGIRFSPGHLARPEDRPDLAAPPPHHVNANSFLETDDPAQVADFLLDALFFVNVGELALFLDDAYGFEEEEFWSLVRDEVRAYQKRFAGQEGMEDRFTLFDVFKPTLEVEKLTTRRLLPDTELRVHAVPNPLSGAGVERC